MLEGNTSGEQTRLHLDRCLTCRSCETTCPSGVQYGRLIEIGRNEIEKRAPRPLWSRLVRTAMLAVIPYPPRMRLALLLGNLSRPLLPASLRRKLPRSRTALPCPPVRHKRRMLVLEGCVQSLTAPSTNAAAARVLDKLGISLLSVAEAGCCGAMHLHMSAPENARDMMRRNIDAWWPHVDDGIEAIVTTASGCSVMVKEYGHALQNDPTYATRAARISSLTRDLSEILRNEDFSRFAETGKGKRVACQSSCTLQHGQKLGGVVEKILQQCGYVLTPVADSHLCCGAAGTYTLLQPALSQQLLQNKLKALEQGTPEVIVTSNIGCQLHLESASNIPVRHWIELLETEIESEFGDQ
jgi:glycolate oxidase iron-sulfur subunit